MNARLWATAVVAALAGSAMGQYALDHSLQVGSGGRNGPGRDFKKELEFRNAIVTGNAPGGISFRGDVGYRAPGEFFSSLGSNDTFAFRRDSAYSGLGGLGLRGPDALQYQFALTTGNSVPTGLTGIPVFGRSGAGAAPGDLPSTRPDGLKDITEPRPGDFGYDTRGLTLMAVRSPSAYVANRGLQPTLLGRTGENSGETKAITASMLRGVAFDDIGVLASRTPKEEKKPESALPSTAVNTGVSSTAPSNTATSTEIHTAYQDLVERLTKAAPEKPGAEKPAADKAATDKTAADKKAEVPEWQRRMDELREHLRDKSRPAPRPAKEGPETGPKPDSTKTDKPDSTKPAPSPNKLDSANPEEGDQSAKPKKTGVDTDTIGLIKRAGERISALAPPSFDAYGTQMKAGQDNLAAGRYFDAEERFTAALSTKAGDPMAMVGRIHAQLGAGMFLSAAINLRGLLTEHPELISTRYGEGLLPIGERRGKILERLDELVAEPGGRGRDPGLLMAYMGFQIGDTAAMKRGLAAMVVEAPKPPAPPDQLAKLADVLGKVWVEGDAKPPTPPAPVAPSPAPKPPEQPK